MRYVCVCVCVCVCEKMHVKIGSSWNKDDALMYEHETRVLQKEPERYCTRVFSLQLPVL